MAQATASKKGMYGALAGLKKAVLLFAPAFTLLVVTLLRSSPVSAQCPVATTETEPDPSSGQISGYVFDPEGQYKIGGARVYAFYHGPEAGILPCAYTDDGGWFFLRDVTPGDYWVVADKLEDGYPDPANALYGYEWSTLPKITVVAGQRNSGVFTHVFPKVGKLELWIADAEAKQPLRGASYHVYREDEPNGGEGGSVTLKEGKTTLLLPPIPCRVEVSEPNHKAWFYGEDGSKEHARGLVIPAGTTRHVDVLLIRAEDMESRR